MSILPMSTVKNEYFTDENGTFLYDIHEYFNHEYGSHELCYVKEGLTLYHTVSTFKDPKTENF